MKLINERIMEELQDFAKFIRKKFKKSVKKVSVVFYVEVTGDLDIDELRKFCPKVVVLKEGPPPYIADDSAGDARM